MTGWSLDAMDIAKFHTLKLSTTVVVYRGKIRKKKNKHCYKYWPP